MNVALVAERDPSLVPPLTVNPVVVAFPDVRLPRAERLVTLIDPKEAPPVTERDVVVAVEAAKLGAVTNPLALMVNTDEVAEYTLKGEVEVL